MKNVLVMSMIGDEGEAAPNLKMYIAANPQAAYDCCLQCIEILYNLFQKCKLVHADFSEYNLLWVFLVTLIS